MERDVKIIKKDSIKLQETQQNKNSLANVENSDNIPDESNLLLARRNLLSSLKFLNQTLGIKCCEQCGHKAA